MFEVWESNLFRDKKQAIQADFKAIIDRKYTKNRKNVSIFHNYIVLKTIKWYFYIEGVYNYGTVWRKNNRA